MIKLSTAILYLKEIQKLYEHVTHLLGPADVSIFSPEVRKICYFKKYRYKLHFDEYISVVKRLKLKVRKFWELISTFAQVTGEKLAGDSSPLPPS